MSALLLEASEQAILMLQRGQVRRLEEQWVIGRLHNLYHEELQFMRLNLRRDNDDKGRSR